MSPPNKNPRAEATSPLHVETVKTVQGPAATAISVDVDRQKLSPSTSAATPTSAVARVPVVDHGKTTVKEEELLRTGTRLNNENHTVDTFAKTVPGGVESNNADFNVGVRVAGETVWAKDELAPQTTKREANRPPTSPQGSDSSARVESPGIPIWAVVGAAGLVVGAGYLGYRAWASRRRKRRYGAFARFF